MAQLMILNSNEKDISHKFS